MPSIIENLNSVITTKNELGYILRENGVNPGEVFSDYPTYFRDVISSGGSDKVTYSYLEERLSDYVSYSYLNDNLSDYPTYSYSNDNYVSYAYLYSYIDEWGQEEGHNLVERVGGLEEKTTQLDYRQGYTDSYLVSYNQRISTLENAGYVSQTSLSSNSYASETYVVDYVNTYASSIIDLTNYVSKSELTAQSYISSIPSEYVTKTFLSNQTYVTESSLSSRGFLTQHQDLSAYATIAYVTEKIPASYDMSLYVTYTYLYSYIGDVVGNVEALLANI